jgi:transcriptional regulator with AAA-type ATPase domain/pSer/pThr/pTyr-binding forkhead associated (FHA) protein
MVVRESPMDGPTSTTPDARNDSGNEGTALPQLYVVLEADRPRVRGARYSLGNIDEVVIGRGGTRNARRESHGGVRRLHLQLPGRYLSSLHGRFQRLGSDWVYEDAHSTNGSCVNGERVTRKQLCPGDIVELGHKLFMLSPAELTPPGTAPDIDGETLLSQPGMATLIPALGQAFVGLRKIAASTLPVVLLGETGTGKELLSAALHQLSERKGPLVAVNCGALTASLAESQLFGHARGAFSGAIRDEPGFLRSAHGGSLLLDEIGDLPEPMQPILLRALQDLRVVPVGSTQAQTIDVRFIAATHKDIPNLVSIGKFRRDLWARLNGFTLSLPPLRARKQDLGLLIADILARHAASTNLTIATDAARALLAHDWPANVRELEQCLVRSCALGDEGVIRRTDLPPEVVVRLTPSESDGVSSTMPHSAWPEADIELRNLVLQRLELHRGNVSEVARSFGKARVQIQRWMKRFGVDARQFRK